MDPKTMHNDNKPLRYGEISQLPGHGLATACPPAPVNTDLEVQGKAYPKARPKAHPKV